MALSFPDRQVLEDVLGMSGGYVLDFNDRTFGEFVMGSISVDASDPAYGPSGTSKAKRLRAIWERQPTAALSKLLADLIDEGVRIGKVQPAGAAAGRKIVAKLAPELQRHVSLRYPSDWRFAGGPIPSLSPQTVADLFAVAIQVTGSTPNQKSAFETFKQEIGAASGIIVHASSDVSWAQSDLERAFDEARRNAATFLDGYWSAIEALREEGASCPSAANLNNLLAKHNAPLRIDPPNLVLFDQRVLVQDSSEAADHRPSALSYTVHEQVGQGGNGTVHRATRETAAGQFEYAIKFFSPHPFSGDDVEKARERFRREVRALASIQHRAIVQYLDAGIDGQGRHYVVMPLIRGSNIRDACGGVPAPAVCALLAEMLLGVAHAHERDLLHRDMKPGNVLVRAADQQVIIVDFGNAYKIEEAPQDSITTHALGTEGYVPTDVWANPKKRTALHDIYSCGIIAYEMFARRRPDPMSYASLSHVHPELAVLDGPIRKAIAGEHERYTRALDFRESLLNAAKQLG